MVDFLSTHEFKPFQAGLSSSPSRQDMLPASQDTFETVCWPKKVQNFEQTHKKEINLIYILNEMDFIGFIGN